MKISKRAKTILIIVVLGNFLGFLNQTLLNVALPSVMHDFGITINEGQWLTNGFMLVNGIMVPLTAFLMERFKTKQLYLSAMTMFTLGTFVSGFAPSFGVLVVGRMLQAVGTGVLIPLQNVIIMRIFPIERRGQAMGIIGLAMTFAPAIGPTLSGWIVSTFTWRYLFYLIAPLALADVLLAVFMMDNEGETHPVHVDIVGISLSIIGVGSLLAGLSNAGEKSWASMSVWGLILLGAAVISYFIYQQKNRKEPLLNFKVFKYHNFTFSTIAAVFVVMALYGGVLLLPLFTQDIQKMSPLTTGYIMLPGALVTAVMSPISGNLYDKFGAKPLAVTGLVAVAIGTFMFANLKVGTSIAYLTIGQLIRSSGIGLINMPLQTEALNSLPDDLLSHGSAMFTTIRQIAGSLTTAVLVAVKTLVTKAAGSNSIANQALGMNAAFLFSAVAAIVAIFFALRLHSKNKQSLVG